MGGAKNVLAVSLKYAKERKAFGTADRRVRRDPTQAGGDGDSHLRGRIDDWRLVGLIEGQLAGFSWDQPDATKTMLKAVEEFAAECSMVKVFGSEMLDYVVDEGVQIHGGYGYHQDYAVERAYRDSRINRIFEGPTKSTGCSPQACC